MLFFGIFFSYTLQIRPKLDRKVDKIGLSGSYTLDSLPQIVLDEISIGLTKVERNGGIVSSAATSWSVSEDGKAYTFHLRNGLTFHNKEPFVAKTISYNFEQVKKKIINDSTIVFELNAPYAPFLVTVSKPILLHGVIGIASYKVRSLEQDAGFVKSITLVDVKDGQRRKTYFFYPTEEALKTAFILGEIDQALNLSDTVIDGTNFSKWKNVISKKHTNYSKLITLFYNNKNENLSNKKLRQALNYSLPEVLPFGERATSPFPPISQYYSESPNSGIYDIDIAISLIKDSGISQESLTFELTAIKGHEKLARIVQESWKKIGVTTKIKVVDEIPDDFQILLYTYRVPKDPDQYTLWHSGQQNNIIHYKNVRIDKLLEEARVTIDFSERGKLYADFQKYLIDDSPASFLIFPFEYTIERK